jgi:tRNA nucleotidyltransferase/poly(A) polymerase
VSAALDAARTALRDQQAWLVGGAVRDRLMGRELGDIDIVLSGNVKAAARRLAMEAGGPAFPLGEEFGAWRVIGPDRSWQVDLSPLRGGSITADLGLRDFTVNAIAEPLHGGALEDPHGGGDDIASFRLRMVSEVAFADDPLRVLRLARFACELGLEPDPDTIAAARPKAVGLNGVAAERIFAELKRIISAERVLEGLELAERLGVTEVVLPEFAALRGVQQNRFHHLDAADHTLAVLQAVVDLQADPAASIGPEHADGVMAWLAQPLADGLTRGQALRFGALLHDIAKPESQLVQDGTVIGFPGHAERGAIVAREILRRLCASERLCAHVADLTRYHLGLGYLVKYRPLDRRGTYEYLHSCDPVGVDVTLLSVADRVATRGDNAQPAIAAHLELARQVIGCALSWEDDRAIAPLVRGDELADALGIEPGPALGPLLAEIAAARYAGDLSTRDEAIAHARANFAV